MEWSKVKIILIALLVGVNLLLAGNITLSVISFNRAEAKAVEAAVRVLESSGIAGSEDVFASMPRSMTAYSFTRDHEYEDSVAGLILGEYSKTMPGGGVASYSKDIDTVIFRSGGNISLSLWIDSDQQAMDYARILAKSAAADMLAVKEDDGRYTIQAGGFEVKNLGLDYRDLLHGSVSTGWIFADVGREEEVSLSRAKLILALADVLTSYKGVQIISASPCYLAQTTQQGDVRLVPVWEIEYGRDTVFVSALSGKQIMP